MAYVTQVPNAPFHVLSRVKSLWHSFWCVPSRVLSTSGLIPLAEQVPTDNVYNMGYLLCVLRRVFKSNTLNPFHYSKLLVVIHL